MGVLVGWLLRAGAVLLFTLRFRAAVSSLFYSLQNSLFSRLSSDSSIVVGLYLIVGRQAINTT